MRLLETPCKNYHKAKLVAGVVKLESKHSLCYQKDYFLNKADLNTLVTSSKISSICSDKNKYHKHKSIKQKKEADQTSNDTNLMAMDDTSERETIDLIRKTFSKGYTCDVIPEEDELHLIDQQEESSQTEKSLVMKN